MFHHDLPCQAITDHLSKLVPKPCSRMWVSAPRPGSSKDDLPCQAITGRHTLSSHFDTILANTITAPPPPTVHNAETETLINTAPRRQGRPRRADSQTLTKTIPQQQQQQQPLPQRQSQSIINRQRQQETNVNNVIIHPTGAPWASAQSLSLF